MSWMPLEEARGAVDKALHEFWLGLATGDGEPTALALRVTVGVGKSMSLRSFLAGTALLILQRGHILVYVPTHALAEEAEAAFRSLETGIPSMVLRGRGAINPVSGARMCVKPEIADAVAKIAPRGVASALCESQAHQGPEPRRQSVCRDGCAWFEQLPGDERRIIFLPQSYLSSALPGAIEENVSLRIIDEKFLPSMTYSQKIYVDDLLQGCARDYSTEDSMPVSLQKARRLVHHALSEGRSVVGELASAGVDVAALTRFEKLEREKQPQLYLTPWMAPGDQRRAIDEFDTRSLFAARAKARLWSMIKEDWATGAGGRISLDREPCSEGPPRPVIRLHSCGKIPNDAPLILLDADADPLIVEAVAPTAKFMSIDVRPNATVVQVEDQTFSDAALLTRPKALLRRREILDVIEREVNEAGGGVLLVATRKVLRQLHFDEDPCHEPGTDQDLMKPLRGAQPRWFGPGMQGVNAYESFNTVIVLGRMQPPIEAIEDQMRAVFGSSGERLEFMPAEVPTRGFFRETERAYLMADGTTRLARVRTHPDPRGAALLSQIREASTLQAIGRIRAVNAQVPKRILILCSIPLPRLPIDHLVLWQELVTDLSRAELSAKSQTLESALYPYGRSAPIAGLRLSGSGLRADAPEVFKKASSGFNWRTGLSTETTCDMVRAIARRRGGRTVFVTLKRRGGGHVTPAVLFDPPADIGAAVERLWPGLELAEVADA
jgi:hypothetical protein